MLKISPKSAICALAVMLLIMSSLKMRAQSDPNELKKIDGTVVKVAPNSITVKTAKGEVTLSLEEKTEITLAEKPAALADLKDGQEVSILTDGTKAVSIKIAVQSA